MFNLDVLEVEAKGTAFTFRHGGRNYTLPAGSDADWRAVMALDQGEIVTGLRGLLGDKEYEQFTSKPLGVAKLEALIKAYLEAQGMAPGELQASPDSSESTEAPSRPTSRGTTASRSAT